VYAKFCCAALRIKKALVIFRELITTTTTTTTTRVAFWDPPSRSNNIYGANWPFMCRYAFKKLLNHSLIQSTQNFRHSQVTTPSYHMILNVLLPIELPPWTLQRYCDFLFSSAFFYFSSFFVNLPFCYCPADYCWLPGATSVRSQLQRQISQLVLGGDQKRRRTGMS